MGYTGHHPTYKMQRFSKLCAWSISLSTCVGTPNSTVGLKSRPEISYENSGCTSQLALDTVQDLNGEFVYRVRLGILPLNQFTFICD